MTVTSWNDLPLTLRMQDIAGIYGINVWTVRKKVERGDEDVPRPAFARPYRWRREDVRKHYEGHSIGEQRKAIARAKREQLKAVG